MITPKFDGWLNHHLSSQSSSDYSHRLLKENLDNRAAVMSELKQAIQNAHEDTKRHLRELSGISLDPFEKEGDSAQRTNAQKTDLGISRRDPTVGYPQKLDMNTLKGFFGEIFAGLVAENFSHFELEGWSVPAYPFRFHWSVFYQLEKWRQIGGTPKRSLGRFGDDMLAFYRGNEGEITHSLVCEAKCSNTHRKRTLDDAHQKASSEEARPVDILRLIDILRDYSDPISTDWKRALQVLYYRDINGDYERCDLVSYVCGKEPVRSATWMHIDKPSPNYTGARRLECVEIHINNVDQLVREVYDVDSE